MISKSIPLSLLLLSIGLALPAVASESALVPPNPTALDSPLDFSSLKFNPYAKSRQKMDIYLDGFYELKYSGRSFTPQNATGSVLEAIRNDPIYLKLPRDVIEGAPKIDPRFRVNAEGKLDEDLSIYFNVEQEPDFPQQHDVRVRKGTSELAFGTLEANFENGPFVSAKKQINGVKAKSSGSDWSALVASGQQRSDPKKYESYGTGESRIKLGNNAILDGSVSVYVNNQLLSEATDYRINYIDGEIAFLKVPPSNRDLVKVIYEFTNPIEDYLPISTRKTFFGAQGQWQTPMSGEWVTTPNNATEILWESAEEAVTENPTFQLKELAVITTSLKVYLNGSPLRLTEDYDYSARTRSIRIKRNLNEIDRLSVEYLYYSTKPVQDSIVADDSRGPYKLSAAIAPNTPVEVWIGDEKAEAIRDYTLDEDNGKIVFGHRIASPQIIRVNYAAIQRQWVIPSAQEAPFHIGATLLNEYAANQNESSAKTIIGATPALIDGASIWVPTENTPLIDTETLLITLDNQEVASSDIAAIDPFLGKITLKSPVTATSTKITYRYQQGIPVDYIFNGHTSISGEYVSGQDGFDIAKLPIRNRGIVGVWAWGSDLFSDGANTTERPLQEGRDFTYTLSDSGQILTLRFKKAGDSIGSQQSFLQKYPDANTRIRIRYLYTPQSSSQVGAINQRLVAVSAGGKLTDKWRIDTDIAVADNNLSKPRISASTTRKGSEIIDATAGKYGLDHTNVVENSEHVWVIDRVGITHTLTKDEDYFINYDLGTLKFRNAPPSQTDTIQVSYDYFDTSQAVAGSNQQGIALNVKTAYSQEDWTYSADYKTLDRNFAPIGTIPYNPGSTIVGGAIQWSPNNQWDMMALDYHRNTEYRAQNDAGGAVNLTRDALSGTAQFTHFNSNIRSRHKALVGYDVEDPRSLSTTGNSLHNIDTLTLRYEPELIIGSGLYTTNLTALGLYSVSDIVDRQDVGKYWQWGVSYRSKFRPIKNMLVQKIGLEPFAKLSRTTSSASNATSVSTYQQIGLNSDIIPMPAMTTTLAIDMDKTTSVSTASVTGSVHSDVQENRHIAVSSTYQPFIWLDLGYSFTQVEQAGYLAQQVGSLENTNASRINRYEPAGMALEMGWMNPNGSDIWAPFKNSFFKGAYSITKRQENNQFKLSDRTWSQLSYNDFEPISGFVINAIGFEKDDSHFSNATPGTDISLTDSRRNKFAKSGQWTLTPKAGFLSAFTNTLQWSDKRENWEDKTLSKVASSNQTFTQIPEFGFSTQVGFKSGPIILENSANSLGQFNGSIQYEKIDKQYAINTYSTAGTTNQSFDFLSAQSRDNTFIDKTTYDAEIVPFDVMNFNGKLITGREAYNRNVQAGVIGSLAKRQLFRELGWQYAPHSLWNLTADVHLDVRRQWKTRTIDVDPSVLEQSGFYENRLFTQVWDSNAALQVRPIQWLLQMFQITSWKPEPHFLAITPGLQWRSITQTNEQVTANLTTPTSFSQTGFKGTLSFIPFTALECAGTGTLYRLVENSNAAQTGKELSLRIAYLPIKTQSSDIAIEFTRTDYYGFGFNTLEQENAAQSSHEDLQYTIRSRRDTVQVLSLRINTIIPLQAASHIDRLILTGEGYLKSIQDQFKGENNYNITGFTFSSRMEFN